MKPWIVVRVGLCVWCPEDAARRVLDMTRIESNDCGVSARWRVDAALFDRNSSLLLLSNMRVL